MESQSFVDVDLGFSVSQSSNGATIVSGRSSGLGTGAKVTTGLLGLFFAVPGGLFLAAILVSILSGGDMNGSFFILFFICVAAIDLGLIAAINKLKQRPFSFEINDQSIMVRGSSYRHTDISEVFIDNPGSNGAPLMASGGMFVGGTGMAGATLATSAVISNSVGNALTLNAAEVAKGTYRVNIRHGRKAICLARALDEHTAVSLFKFLTEDQVAA